ncbi:histidine utilization repressor (plasmid) [Sinorhizobium sp. BG8]|nr:histidine utilization repressor [Sinorhizobium sp. BG8]
MSGEWPPGHRLPFEVDLATHYDCSRMTVNKVMTQLAKSGLIERRKKSGSFVTQPQAQSAVLEIHDIEAEVRSLNLPYSFEVTRRVRRKATAADIRQLEVSAGTMVLHTVCTHFAGQRPFCVEERLINVANVPEAIEADFQNLSPGQWLLSQVPWSAAEHRIQAVAAGHDMAQMLGIASGTACLVVERRTWSSLGPITHVRFTYPGDRHALVARFTPASQ